MIVVMAVFISVGEDGGSDDEHYGSVHAMNIALLEMFLLPLSRFRYVTT